MGMCTAEDVFKLMTPDPRGSSKLWTIAMGAGAPDLAQLAASANVTTKTLAPALQMQEGERLTPSNFGGKASSQPGLGG